ncbi:Gfo/Idh/MocA family oxidoreductase [bacterium]|nr:Gfo/Idh/MocA family oxidoreductase [bacterium]
MRHVTRRGFLRGATAAAAAPLFVGSAAFGANDRITTGIIGRGGPAGGGAGGTHLLAVCDVREDKVAGFRGNKEVKVYGDFRELLTRDDIDAVLIGTPDHWHAMAAIRSAEAGKDIYCEKPMSLTLYEARAMVNAVRRHGVVFQTGSQQRSEYGGKFRFACEMVRSGRIGRLHTVHVNVGGPSRECYLPAEPQPKTIDWNMWLGPAPWRPFHHSIGLSGSWRSWRDYSGGGMTDWGHHHFDIVQWALDKDGSGPEAVFPPDGKEFRHLTYIYRVNGEEVRVTHGGASGGQIEFVGTEGRIMVDRGTLKTDPGYIMATPTGPSEVQLFRSPGHKANWVDCIRTRRRPICDVAIGCRSVSVCHIGNLAYWLKRPLKWDAVKEEFIDDPAANRWLDRPKRAPWAL